jgi:hypothetical protein
MTTHQENAGPADTASLIDDVLARPAESHLRKAAHLYEHDIWLPNHPAIHTELLWAIAKTVTTGPLADAFGADCRHGSP